MTEIVAHLFAWHATTVMILHSAVLLHIGYKFEHLLQASTLLELPLPLMINAHGTHMILYKNSICKKLRLLV